MKTSNILLLGLLAFILLSITSLLIFAKSEMRFANVNTKMSGKIIEQQRVVPAFYKIGGMGHVKVKYTQGNMRQVRVVADSAIIEMVITKVTDGKLQLYFVDDVEIANPVEIYVTNDSIDYLGLENGADFVSMNKMYSTNFEIVALSGSVFEITGEYNFVNLKMDTGTVGNMSGKTEQLTAVESTGCVFNADNFASKIASISGNTGAVMNVSVSDEISVEANTGCVIKCIGKPLVKRQDVNTGGIFSMN